MIVDCAPLRLAAIRTSFVGVSEVLTIRQSDRHRALPVGFVAAERHYDGRLASDVQVHEPASALRLVRFAHWAVISGTAVVIVGSDGVDPTGRPCRARSRQALSCPDGRPMEGSGEAMACPTRRERLGDNRDGRWRR